jgi:hypothetical protein
MPIRPPRRLAVFAAAGDLAVYLVATLVGFASHQELRWSAVGRMGATWIPVSMAWLVAAFGLGLLDPDRLVKGPRLGRVLAGALLAAGVGAWLRSLWLGGSLVGIFVLVMAAVTGGSLVAWRWAFSFVSRRSGAKA